MLYLKIVLQVLFGIVFKWNNPKFFCTTNSVALWLLHNLSFVIWLHNVLHVNARTDLVAGLSESIKSAYNKKKKKKKKRKRNQSAP